MYLILGGLRTIDLPAGWAILLDIAVALPHPSYRGFVDRCV
jgi:hypothetical protein